MKSVNVRGEGHSEIEADDWLWKKISGNLARVGEKKKLLNQKKCFNIQLLFSSPTKVVLLLLLSKHFTAPHHF